MSRKDFLLILPPFPEKTTGQRPVIFRPVTDKARAFSQSYTSYCKRGIALGIVIPENEVHNTLDAITKAGLSIEVL